MTDIVYSTKADSSSKGKAPQSLQEACGQGGKDRFSSLKLDFHSVCSISLSLSPLEASYRGRLVHKSRLDHLAL